jgi:F-type H+-transporting ATPase subunit alpha
MKQKQYAPLSVAEMAVLLYAADNKYLNDVTVNKIASFEAALLSYLNADHSALMKKINEAGDYNDEIQSGIKSALDKFKATQTW